MESWIRNQCSFNYRSQSFKLSQTLKSLFTGKKVTKNETDPFLVREDSIKHRQLKESDFSVKTDCEDGKQEKIWRRLSLHSFRKRREKRQEDKKKPMIPAVLTTYDKQKKEQKDKVEWL